MSSRGEGAGGGGGLGPVTTGNVQIPLCLGWTLEMQAIKRPAKWHQLHGVESLIHLRQSKGLSKACTGIQHDAAPCQDIYMQRSPQRRT